MSNVFGGVQFPERTILVVPFELMRIAGGNPMAFKTSDGEDVTIRLYTAEEFVEAQHVSAAGTGAPLVDYDRAEELTRPLNI